MTQITFGEWLRDQRKSAGLTQETLAARVGLVKGQVSRLESGLQRATADIARPIIDALNADPAEAAEWLSRMEATRASAPRPIVKAPRRSVTAAQDSHSYRSF